MKTTHRTPWRTRLQIALWRHGSLGAALLAALLVAAALLAWFLQQADATLAQTRLSMAQTHRNSPAVRPPDEASHEADRLTALRAVLAASPAPDEVVRQMAALSQRSGIAWVRGEYRSQWHADAQATQWHITQPVLTTYPQLRQLIDAVLRAHPNVSLDQVAVQREDTTQMLIKVRLRWSIWTLGEAIQR